MNILDYVVPKKGWGYLLPQNGTSEEEEPLAPEAEQTEPARAETREPDPISTEAQKSEPGSTGTQKSAPASTGTQKSAPASAEAQEPEPVSPDPVAPPAMEASSPSQREEDAASAAPAPPSPALEPSPPRADSYSSDGPLEADLRDLFSEASVMDPQLASLLGRIGDLAADDLAAELRDFSRAIGADGAGSGGRTPG